jgi:small subunit ribosomal protein S15
VQSFYTFATSLMTHKLHNAILVDVCLLVVYRIQNHKKNKKMVTKEKKAELFAKHGFSKTAKDTGSPEAQIALFTHRINELTEHLKLHKKDHSTRLGLIKLVGKRKSLLNYLQKIDITRYRAVLVDLNLRK